MPNLAPRWLLVATVLAAVLVAGGWLLLRARQALFHPPPPPLLPAEVSQSLESLLLDFEASLLAERPEAGASFRPGLSDPQIALLEAELGVALPSEVRALYRWHDGQPDDAAFSIVPDHRFMPLAEALHERALVRVELASGGVVQRAWTWLLAGHRDGWLTVFRDGAGDGYFLDTQRFATPGYFFYNMAETGDFVVFPSLRNFVAGLVECHRTGAIRYDPQEGRMVEDFDRSQPIWARFGTATP